jgi:hypothetical protein
MLYTHVAAALLGAAIAATGAWKIQQSRVERLTAQYKDAVHDAGVRARAKEQELNAERQKTEVRYAQLRRKAASDAAGASGELERLRSALAGAAGSGQNTPATRGADGDPRNAIIGECAAAATTLAQHADGLAAQLLGLQDYVRNVCTK